MYKRLSLPASTFTGGTGTGTFSSHERFRPGTGLKGAQTSQSRAVVTVGGRGTPKNQIRARFVVTPDFLPSAERRCSYIVRLQGMWDYQRCLGPEFATMHRHLPTFGHFRVAINGTTIFDGRVFYWSYRQWRFWPAAELPLDMLQPDTLQPDTPLRGTPPGPPPVIAPPNTFPLREGENELVFENHTGPFPEEIPDHYRALVGIPQGETEPVEPREIPPETRNNTTFHLSDIHLLCRANRDMEVLNAPRYARMHEPFPVELYSFEPGTLLADDVPEGISIEAGPIARGRNTVFITAGKPACDGTARLARNDGSAVELTLPTVVGPREGDEFLLGHIIGGHLSAFPVGHSYAYIAEQFRDSRQGNTLAWLADPRKAGDYVTAENVPVDDILRNKLNVLFRYYGNFPEGDPYPDRMAELMDQLGARCVGVAPHEQGLQMLRRNRPEINRRELLEEFTSDTRRRLEGLREFVGPDRLVWITDPSLYANFYRDLGADLVGLELFSAQCNMNAASVRGTCRTYRDSGWAAINSFECQAYGGLKMMEPMNTLDDRFDQKRADLWWFSQFYLYLSGARIIYTESGAFHTIVTQHLDFDDPESIRFRDGQRELWDFAGLHDLRGQPDIDIAFLKSQFEVFSDQLCPTGSDIQAGDFTWERARAAFPDVRWSYPAMQSVTLGMDTRRYFSDAPTGEADIVAFGPRPVPNTYKGLVLIGDHELRSAEIEQLRDYVSNGGRILLSVRDILGEESTDDSRVGLSAFGGVRLGEREEAGYLWELDVRTEDPEGRLERIVRPCVDETGAYGATVLSDLEFDGEHEVLIRDGFTGVPFLVSIPVGSGQVWLVNSRHYGTSREHCALYRAIVELFIDALPPRLRTVSGGNVSWFTYPDGRGYFLNNNWYDQERDAHARLRYGSLEFPVVARRGRVGQLLLAGDAVLVGDCPDVRLDLGRARAGDVARSADTGGPNVGFRVSGHGRTNIHLYAARDVAKVVEVAESADAGSPQVLRSLPFEKTTEGHVIRDLQVNGVRNLIWKI